MKNKIKRFFISKRHLLERIEELETQILSLRESNTISIVPNSYCGTSGSLNRDYILYKFPRYSIKYVFFLLLEHLNLTLVYNSPHLKISSKQKKETEVGEENKLV
jgi:hypothetical protein